MLKSGAVNSEFHGESIGATFRTITERNQKLRSIVFPRVFFSQSHFFKFQSNLQ
jgi:hypothetical protein